MRISSLVCPVLSGELSGLVLVALMLGAVSCAGDDDPFCDGDPPPIVFLPRVTVVDPDGNPACPPAGATVRVVEGTRDSTLVPLRHWDPPTDPRPCHVFESVDAFNICPPDNVLTATVSWPGCGDFETTVAWRGAQLTVVADCPVP